MSEQEENNDRSPLWKYVTRVHKVAGGGNVAFKCSYCGGTFKGSYSRVKAHLLKFTGYGIRVCSAVTPQQLTEMKRVVEEADLRLRNSLPIQVLLPSSASNKTCSSSASDASASVEHKTYDVFQLKKRKGASNCAIDKANSEAWEELDALIARMFYSGGVPFHLARNPYFIASFVKAVANSDTLQGYTPPSYNSLRTTLLQNERANIERQLEPIKNSWKEKGLSLVINGWKYAHTRPIFNIMAVTKSGPMFLKAINCEGEYKDKDFIANFIKEAICEVGPHNVVQVITDNSPACKSAGLLIEARFPHIFWTPCMVYTLDLALKNICRGKETDASAETFRECGWIKEIIEDVMVVKFFITNHSMKCSIFNEHAKLKLLSSADTCFASSVVILRRFKQIKQSLQSMTISSHWMAYREGDVERASFVKKKLLDDMWWDKIDYILSFTGPIYDMLRTVDTERACLHLVYDMWESMIEKVKVAIFRHEAKQDNESPFCLMVCQILVDLWRKSITPLNCLAHSLNPRYYSMEWLQASPNHVPPHKDEEISTGRQKCFERYFPNVVERRQANTEYAKFSATLGDFADSDSVNDRALMDPYLWWVVHGSFAPLLQNIALKLLGQPCSSVCCQRNWSTYSFVNSLKMNKMTPQRGEDLIFVHSNLRLLSRKAPEYTQGETKMWDVGGDTFDSLEDFEIPEIGDLSLDEPELEAMLFHI